MPVSPDPDQHQDYRHAGGGAEVTGAPLEPGYNAVAFDVLRVKIRDNGVVRNTAVNLVLSVQPDGTNEGPSLLGRADRRRGAL